MSSSSTVKLLKSCIEPNFELIPVFSEIEGVIKQIVCPKKYLCFIVQVKDFAIINEIEELKPESLYKIAFPNQCTRFLFHDKSKGVFRRAFVLQSHPQNSTLKLFLYDYGEVLNEEVTEDQYFYMPGKIEDIPTVAYFSKIDVVEHMNRDDGTTTTIPNLENCLRDRKVLKLKVTSNSSRRKLYDFVSRERYLCLQIQLNHETENIRESKNQQQMTSIDDFKIYEPSSRSYFLDDLPKFANCIETGSMICVYPNSISICDDEELTFYVNFLTLNDCVVQNFSFDCVQIRLFEMKFWLNQDLAIDRFEKLDETPKINQLVVASGVNSSYERAVIKSLDPTGQSCQLFFIDHGFTRHMNINKLFKFPTKCLSIPPQCIKLTVMELDQNLKVPKSNKSSSSPLLTNSMFMAQVESTTLVDGSQVNVRAKLFTLTGHRLTF